jgi:hypothetical protein
MERSALRGPCTRQPRSLGIAMIQLFQGPGFSTVYDTQFTFWDRRSSLLARNNEGLTEMIKKAILGRSIPGIVIKTGSE